MKKTAVFWFRRDLRVDDNSGLFEALKNNDEVIPVFIFDTNIINSLKRNDKRILFIHNALRKINQSLQKRNSSLLIYKGTPVDAFKYLSENFSFQSVYCNEDYEPYAIKRDNEIAKMLYAQKIDFKQFKDQVIFSKNDIIKADGKPYTVFTPYKNKWRSILNDDMLKPFNIEKNDKKFMSVKRNFPELEELGFFVSEILFPTNSPSDERIIDYNKTRDFPAINGTSRLSIHLRFGTASIRKWVKKALELNETFLNELIWREFYMMILYHYPQVITQSFKPVYDRIVWRNNESEFEAWSKGLTGYPLVDAGMRELNTTGFMHNRARMVTASFLTKHLLCDWRLGEAYFAEKLLDYELASNNGGWQWAAGTGCDAAPYFRIFNPITQQLKFDKEMKYISKWIPELNSGNYLLPIVEHTYARERCLKAYKSIF